MYESKVEVNISGRNCLPQDWLISHHDLKRVQKINCMEFLLLYSMLLYVVYVVCITMPGINQK